MFNLQDKVVLITGATGGIGGAIANKMKEAGATVVITGRNLEKLSSFDDSFIKIQSDLSVDGAAEKLVNDTIEKTGARHLRVVRPREGEEVELFDGQGRSRVFKVRGPRLDGAGCLSPVSETLSFERSTLDLTLFACVTKGSRWDWTIEKATELGATRIVPVISDRTIVRIPGAERAAKRERWLRIAEDAARQSDAKWLPEITEATDFRETLPLVRETACFIGALTDPPSPPISVAYGRVITAGREEGRTVVPLSTYIGPEGDFTPEELAALMEVATPVSFGPTVLRAETAAIFALSALRTLSLGRGF